MNIDKIKKFQKILNSNIKIDFKDIIYGSIYKIVNNTLYENVTFQIKRYRLYNYK
jgi:hypothetical protein